MSLGLFKEDKLISKPLRKRKTKKKKRGGGGGGGGGKHLDVCELISFKLCIVIVTTNLNISISAQAYIDLNQFQLLRDLINVEVVGNRQPFAVVDDVGEMTAEQSGMYSEYGSSEH